MVKMRYIGGGDVVLVRRSGEQIELRNGAEVDLTEEEVAGCACQPERIDGVWERVATAAKGQPKVNAEAKGE